MFKVLVNEINEKCFGTFTVSQVFLNHKVTRPFQSNPVQSHYVVMVKCPINRQQNNSMNKSVTV